MRYLWEVLLEAAMEQIPEKLLRFEHDPLGSAYMELSLPCLNQTGIRENGENGDIITIGLNTYYRFYEIFKDIYAPDQQEFLNLWKSFTNLMLHMLAQKDLLSGMTKEDYYKRLLADEVMDGGYGDTVREVFLDMAKDEQEVLLGWWIRSFRTGSSLKIFIGVMHDLVTDNIVYHCNDRPDVLMIYTGQKKERRLERRIGFLINTFLDIRYHIEIFYEYHFGIIGMEETMQIGEIAIC